jgi:hypothetical protein
MVCSPCGIDARVAQAARRRAQAARSAQSVAAGRADFYPQMRPSLAEAKVCWFHVVLKAESPYEGSAKLVQTTMRSEKGCACSEAINEYRSDAAPPEAHADNAVCLVNPTLS